MRTRILALTAIVVLATTAIAVAGTNRFSTAVKSQPGSKISFKIKTNRKGTATKVTSLKVTGIKTMCTSRTDNRPPVAGPTASATFGSVRIRKQIPASTGKPSYSFGVQKQAGGAFWNIQGELTSRKGRKVVGNVLAQVNSETQLCEEGGKFSAKRK